MSDTELPEDPPPDAILAGELVLGVLDLPAQRAAEARAEIDPGFAAHVGFWEQRLLPLTRLVPPVAPPAALWQRLQNAIGLNDNSAALRAWKTATAASLALAAGLAAFAFVPRQAPSLTVASLAPLNAAGPGFIARVAANGTVVVHAVGAHPAPTGRDYELWALPEGATRPVPLGVIPVGGLSVAASHVTLPGGKLLVSLEPKGGSPTGLPTGPVLYGGVITRL